MKRVLVTMCMMIAGCATFTSTYSYRAINDNCNCEEYRSHDKERRILYRFRAYYNMRGGIHTTIEIEITNNGNDTLFLDNGAVKISSKNISYQYNNKLVPLPHLFIEPSHSDVVRMVGSDISGTDDWNKIAGEQLTLTLQGIRLGERPVASQRVTFIPVNPKLQQ
jgi:hypothetical protein